jgi:23S rRNA pseudouridine955/2504/2580 synthase/23S rRNA pseudouridine1911/1915/1917 synthase
VSGSAALSVLFSDANFIAVEKPAGLATIPGRGESDSVLERLARQLNLPASGEDDPRVRVVHRLDKDTSGVLLFALNRPAQQHVSHQFQNNTVAKEYLALVHGRPTENEGIVDAPLAPHPASPRRMAVVKRGGRPARTEWRLEESFRGFSLIRCFPRTGKTHQIRVHLAHTGMPLAIDPLYSSGEGILLSQFKRGYRPTRGEEERPLIDRLTLHAERLAFEDRSGSRIELAAPLPRDFRAVLNQLRRHARR